MSILKIVGIIAIGLLALFILLMYIALSPTIRNVSDNASLKKLLNKPLTIKRDAIIYYCEGSYYSFVQYSLIEDRAYPCVKKYEIPPGTTMIIQKFKTYKNAVSGFTHLYALAEVQLGTGEKLKVEYDWGSTDLAEFAEKTPELPLAIWQVTGDPLVTFSTR
jgi:hypothetical protein